MRKYILPILLSGIAIAASAAVPTAAPQLPLKVPAQDIRDEDMIVREIPGTDSIVCMTPDIIRISNPTSSILLHFHGHPTPDMVSFMQVILDRIRHGDI